MEQVKDILKLLNHKGHECMNEEKFVYDALQAMSHCDIRCLLVVREGVLVGLFTDTMYARKVLIKGKSSWKSVLGTVMETEFQTVTPETTMHDCQKLLQVGESRYLPVVVDGLIVGIISNTDVDKSIMRDQINEIEILKDYVYDRR